MTRMMNAMQTQRADTGDPWSIVVRAWRDHWPWALLLGGVLIGRTALDWFAPAADPGTRSVSLTALTAGILLSAGFWAGRRGTTAMDGARAGLTTAVFAGVLGALGAGVLLLIRPATITASAVNAGGGFGEILMTPMMLVVPGLLLGLIGGFLGTALRSRTPVRRDRA
jgi:hypothetical protein